MLQEIRQLQSFPNKNAMDLRVRAFLYHHKATLSPGALQVLKFIWRHSVKFPGVSFAKIDTIMEKTSRSRSTVIRAINIFVAKGLMKRVPAVRPNGKRGVNFLVILPEETAACPWEKEAETEQPEGSTLKPAPAHKSDIKKAVSKPMMDTDYLPAFIPKAFIKLTKPYLQITDIYAAWGSVMRAYRQMKLNYPVDHYIDVITKTFKQAIFLQKQGAIKKTFLGYFYGGMRNSFTQVGRKEIMDDPSNLYYDWLHES
ncbi:helix-turn-helix domain-containing protein [Thalassobacillus devorans]|uniref:helix-turn-helix domain-containing protein n=1 Tax=Thalassobacillus devorans TaxID=279813 RepID=UPI0015943C14|nr:helix-turn-helix domain-containing protein [Thalassobacillus devorans]